MFEFYTIALIALLAAVSPGPDFVVVAKNAISYNRRSAIMTSLGISAGILVHSTYCILGLGLIISQSLLLFSLIKYVGAAYLIYLGLKSLFSKSGPMPTIKKSDNQQHNIGRAFLDGLLTNVLNPKCTLFMLSIFTVVVKPHTSLYVQAIYGIEIAVIAAVWFVFLSYGLTHASVKARVEKVQHHATKVIGVILIALGIAVIFESR